MAVGTCQVEKLLFRAVTPLEFNILDNRDSGTFGTS